MASSSPFRSAPTPRKWFATLAPVLGSFTSCRITPFAPSFAASIPQVKVYDRRADGASLMRGLTVHEPCVDSFFAQRKGIVLPPLAALDHIGAAVTTARPRTAHVCCLIRSETELLSELQALASLHGRSLSRGEVVRNRNSGRLAGGKQGEENHEVKDPAGPDNWFEHCGNGSLRSRWDGWPCRRRRAPAELGCGMYAWRISWQTGAASSQEFHNTGVDVKGTPEDEGFGITVIWSAGRRSCLPHGGRKCAVAAAKAF